MSAGSCLPALLNCRRSKRIAYLLQAARFARLLTARNSLTLQRYRSAQRARFD
jgi:hypothetical protein